MVENPAVLDGRGRCGDDGSPLDGPRADAQSSDPDWCVAQETPGVGELSDARMKEVARLIGVSRDPALVKRRMRSD